MLIRGQWNLRRDDLRWVRHDLGSERTWVAIENDGYRLSPHLLILAVVFAVATVTVGSTVLPSGETFTVELQALRVFAGAALLLSGLLVA